MQSGNSSTFPFYFLLNSVTCRKFTALLYASLLLFAPAAYSDNPSSSLDVDITHASIEDLLSMNVSSVSKTDESFWGSPAALYVLTNEKIRRSGATSLPEALRLVPGVQVAKIDGNKWAVSIRGFNSRSSNKLLVLIDGRSVYDPLYSGILWESKDVVLEDVERIEVIRGPGGTLWGANAVNGVINVITKHAKDTQGTMVSAGIGTEERAFSTVRYGTGLGPENYLRFYGKGNSRDSGYRGEANADDDSNFNQTGFRFDSALDKSSVLTLQGDLYGGKQGNYDQSVSEDQETYGGNLLTHWNRKFDDLSELSVLAHYDRTKYDANVLIEKRNIANVEVKYQLAPLSRHRIVTGLNYNFTDDDIESGVVKFVDPDHRTDQVVSLFAEDRIEIARDKFFLTLGSKFEHNDYTGYEGQPTARVSWVLDQRNSLWGAVSRAVRVPSRLEDNLKVPVSPGVFFEGRGAVDSETLTAYEAGYRFHPNNDWFLDLTSFYNVYDKLVTLENLVVGNKSEGDTYGAEAALTWQALPYWKIESAYTFLIVNLRLDDDSVDDLAARVDTLEGSDPQNQYSLQSLIDLGSNWDFDVALRYVDSLPSLKVASYIVGDIRLAYRPSKEWELSIVAQNLFEDHHYEQGGSVATAVQQGVFTKVLWRF